MRDQRTSEIHNSPFFRYTVVSFFFHRYILIRSKTPCNWLNFDSDSERKSLIFLWTDFYGISEETHHSALRLVFLASAWNPLNSLITAKWNKITGVKVQIRSTIAAGALGRVPTINGKVSILAILPPNLGWLIRSDYVQLEINASVQSNWPTTLYIIDADSLYPNVGYHIEAQNLRQ